MEEQLQYPLAVTHLLQHTLRSLCIHEDSQWVYAVFWRILPRNYPPPKWDLPGSLYDRSRGNRRNWILVWEDGFCNFEASCEGQDVRGLQPELFFKMSHEIYNYGEGLIGKVASDHSHKWVSKEPHEDQEINFLSSWHNPADSHPRTWEAHFQSGIKTIALIAVREGVVQLGAINKTKLQQQQQQQQRSLLPPTGPPTTQRGGQTTTKAPLTTCTVLLTGVHHLMLANAWLRFTHADQFVPHHQNLQKEEAFIYS